MKKTNFYLPIIAFIIGASLGLFFQNCLQNTKSIKVVQKQDSITVEKLWIYINSCRISHPKVVLAQAILESNLSSNVFSNYNNLFGMKKAYCRIALPSNKDIGVYKYYDNWRESVLDYAFWQLQQGDLSSMSDDEYIKHIASRYSETRDYIKRINIVINTLKAYN